MEHPILARLYRALPVPDWCPMMTILRKAGLRAPA